MLKRLILVLILSLAPAAVLRAQPAPRTASNEFGKPEATAVEQGHDHDHGTGASADDHEKPGLLPDLHKSETWYSALWVVIIFVVLLAVLYPTAWKNVLAGLKARESKIRQDIADAEAARGKAEATLKDLTAKLAAAEASAREIINKAAIDAESVAANIRARSQQEAEETREKAIKEIEAAKTTAVRELYDQAATLATSVAEKILRRNLNADDQRDLVAQSLERVQSVGKN